MNAPEQLPPGTVVRGPFHSDDDRARGVGVIVEPGREVWTRVPAPYVAVRVIVGDRASGGYHPNTMTPIPELRPA